MTFCLACLKANTFVIDRRDRRKAVVGGGGWGEGREFYVLMRIRGKNSALPSSGREVNHKEVGWGGDGTERGFVWKE